MILTAELEYKPTTPLENQIEVSFHTNMNYGNVLLALKVKIVGRFQNIFNKEVKP